MPPEDPAGYHPARSVAPNWGPNNAQAAQQQAGGSGALGGLGALGQPSLGDEINPIIALLSFLFQRNQAMQPPEPRQLVPPAVANMLMMRMLRNSGAGDSSYPGAFEQLRSAAVSSQPAAPTPSPTADVEALLLQKIMDRISGAGQPAAAPAPTLASPGVPSKFGGEFTPAAAEPGRNAAQGFLDSFLRPLAQPGGFR